uniref:SFRICE_002871 n=1 Tax=Spodoptera frugiperda TaxID=7108 RepID=A0A2H1V8D6_SPOFR
MNDNDGDKSYIAQLVDDVRRLQASLTALQEAHAQQLQRLEERLDEKKQHIARLEARLDTQRDYDDIKREIRNECLKQEHNNKTRAGTMAAAAQRATPSINTSQQHPKTNVLMCLMCCSTNTVSYRRRL